MAYIGPEPNPGQNREVDDISSGFNGSEVNFTLQVNSQNVSPGSSNAIIVSLGGVVQNPGTDYTVAASTLTFTTAPASGLSFFGLVLGQGVDSVEPADGSVTSAKIADGAIVNVDVNASAAIAGSKISPDFGSQDVTIGDSIIHSGDTNTKIRFPAADTITAETGGSERFRIDSSGNLKADSGFGSVTTIYGVRAWLKMYWNSGTPTISGSGNVSSLTDAGTGEVTINFSTNMPDVNYATCVSGDEFAQSQAPLFNVGFSSRGYTTSAVTVGTTNFSGNVTDIKSVQVIIVR